MGATADWLREGHGREAAVLWIGRRDLESRVTAVVLMRGVGVDEEWGGFTASPEVLGTITRWAKPKGLALLADAHGHPRGVPGRLSAWDRRHGLRVPEFLSIVAGDGGRDVPEAWGWYVFQRGQRSYRLMTARQREGKFVFDPALSCQLMQADAVSVRELS